MGLTLKDPRPSCIRPDPYIPHLKPKADQLNGLVLMIREPDRPRYMRYVGKQISVSGRILFTASSDTSSFKLVDVKFLSSQQVSKSGARSKR